MFQATRVVGKDFGGLPAIDWLTEPKSHFAMQPPSITSIAPVTKFDADEAK